ncbi:MAG: PssD/Cps14F family polysaccharide biosynthesis glycosyltransferase [Thermoplasmata archaeon]
MKVCLISTTGGHLVQILMLKEVYQDLDHYFVTVKNDFSEKVMESEKSYYITQILRDPGKLLVNALEGFRILKKERPDVIITTGAGDVLPTCILGKIMGSKVVFLETFARVRKPSLVGRFLVPFADKVLVQWQSMTEHYKNAIYSGPIYVATERERLPERPRIFMATGTHTASFHRLVEHVDAMVEKGEIEVSGAQIGHSSYEPKNFPWERFISFDRFLKSLRDSDIVLTHDGASSMGLALSFGKHVIVVPRKKEYGEVEYASKQDLARYLAGEGLVTMVENVEDIGEGISRAMNMGRVKSVEWETGPIEIIEDYLSTL